MAFCRRVGTGLEHIVWKTYLQCFLGIGLGGGGGEGMVSHSSCYPYLKF